LGVTPYGMREGTELIRRSPGQKFWLKTTTLVELSHQRATDVALFRCPDIR